MVDSPFNRFEGEGLLEVTHEETDGRMEGVFGEGQDLWHGIVESIAVDRMGTHEEWRGRAQCDIANGVDSLDPVWGQH